MIVYVMNSLNSCSPKCYTQEAKKKSLIFLYITPEIKAFLGEDLTDHADDMQYEHRTLIRHYIELMIRELNI